jgi:hypothetical protein
MSTSPCGRLAALLAGVCLAASLMAAGPAPAKPASYQAVPKAVADFYRDLLGMFSQLSKDLNAARDAKAVARAFRSADAGAETKKLPARYTALSRQYPEFFGDNDGSDGSWTPPADWLRLSREYEAQMQAYGESAGNLATFIGTPEVQEAMEAFDTRMQQMAPQEEN